MEVVPSHGRHVVLGGSYGIGRAYADYWARRTAQLHIVARDYDKLSRARDELLGLGASSCDLTSGDLTSESFRLSLGVLLTGVDVISVFIGGPSPPAGKLSALQARDFRDAAEIALAYPIQVLQQLGSFERTTALSAIILSSSATQDLLSPAHPFYLSALLRRALDESIATMTLPATVAVAVWRPHVVLTPLALRYGAARNAADPVAGLREGLRDPLVSLPTAAEYVESVMIQGMSK